LALFVLMPILYSFGWENTLYLIGQTPTYTYSDMNGYGHFVPSMFWSITYWFAICAPCSASSRSPSPVAEPEDSLRARTRLALQRAPRLLPAALLFAIIAVGAGSWYFYNAHVLNEYLDSKARRDIQADYERNFKKYENLPQPKVTAVDATINIYPERRSFDGSVRMTLQNKTTSRSRKSTSPIRCSRSPISSSIARFTSSVLRRGVCTPSMLSTSPWRPARPSPSPATWATRLAASATATNLRSSPTTAPSFDADYVPYIGYNTNGIELDDPRRRREEHLPLLEEMAHRGDPVHSVNNVFFRESPTGSPITRLSALQRTRLPSLPDTCSASGKPMAAISSNTAWVRPTCSTSSPIISGHYQGEEGDLSRAERRRRP
jgi:ABC-2 type transport system permease protein